jgi:hypothetical protein
MQQRLARSDPSKYHRCLLCDVLLPILSPLNFVFAKRVIFALIYTRALFLSKTAEERAEALDIIPDSLRILPAAQGHSRSRSHDAPVSS